MRKIALATVTGLLGCFVLTPAQAVPVLYNATLIAENNSGISGTALISLDGSQLTVTINATGLVPTQVHPSHIHGKLGADAPTTTLAPPTADTNKDGYVEKTEGAVFEGPPIFDLPPTGVPAQYSTAPGGVVSFTQTYNVADSALYDPDKLGLTLTPNDILDLTGGNTVPLTDRLVELHGLFVPAGIDGTVGTPGTLVYDQEMPAAAGLIRLTAVPEPASLALMGAGLAALRLRSRKRRA